MRDILTSPRAIEIQRRKRAVRIRLGILFLILLISIIGGLAYFSADSHVTINTIVVTGNRTIHQDKVEEVIANDMTGRYFYLFEKKNSFIYPKSKIYTDLLAAFPRIETLSISRGNIHTLHISITERSGMYLYCGDHVPEVVTDIGENCYFINSDGYIFDHAPYFSGNVYFKYYLPLAGDATTPLGKQIFTPANFRELTKFIDGLSALGFTSDSIILDPAGDDTLNLVGSSATAHIVWRNDNNLDTILNNLSLAMQKPEFANQIKQKYSTLEYIDLRFDNKVLYKFN